MPIPKTALNSHRFAKRLPPGEFLIGAKEYGIDDETAQAASENYENNLVTWLGASAHMGSGKDTVMNSVIEKLDIPALQLSIANAIKDESDQVLAIVRDSDSKGEAASGIRNRFNINENVADKIVGNVFDIAHEDPEMTARSRYPEIRTLLQSWGAERRYENENIWLEKILPLAYSAMANGRSVYVTDARFVTDVSVLSSLGMWSIRLEVSPETQEQRITSRDGHKIDAEALTHISETALDGYQDFDLVIDNNGQIEPSINKIINFLVVI